MSGGPVARPTPGNERETRAVLDYLRAVGGLTSAMVAMTEGEFEWCNAVSRLKARRCGGGWVHVWIQQFRGQTGGFVDHFTDRETIASTTFIPAHVLRGEAA